MIVICDVTESLWVDIAGIPECTAETPVVREAMAGDAPATDPPAR